ncbi:MAG: GNAT family N-acetyltransferase [Bacteroidales bacterium]|nr:GNAT family N-acetyltransferase [Bacteroidales bacterium]
MEGLIYTTEIPDKVLFYSLFETTGWNDQYQLNADELMIALKNSWYMISAYDGDRLVGFGRMICDGVVHALILDLIVLPDYRNQGIGGQILDKLVKKCRQHQIRDIQLFCAKGYTGFYENLGFKKRPDEAPGMEIKLFL